MTIAVVGGFLGLLAVTGSLIVADALSRPPTELEIRVETLRYVEPKTPEERLRGSPERLRPYLAEWRAIRDAPDFAALPQDLRAYVEERLSELETYIPWLEGLEETPRPRDALTEEELHAIQGRLDGPLAPPRPGWDDTDAGRLRRRLSAEDEALLGAIAALRTWYQRLCRGRRALDVRRPRRRRPGLERLGQGRGTPTRPRPQAALRRRGRRAEHRPAVDLRGGGGIRVGGGGAAQWEAVRGRLRRLLNVGAALGLIEGLKGKPALLVVPPDGLTLEQAGARFRDLRAAYPAYATEFVRDGGLPQAVADEVGRRARRDYERLLEPARRWSATSWGPATRKRRNVGGRCATG